MGFVITILMLNVIIFVHEFGHLIFAKLAKIGVLEFSLGMGPKLFGLKFKSTDYNFRLLPVGGFVKLAGMDESDDKIDEKYFFQNASFLNRFNTLFAGSFFNLILGFFIFFSILLFVGKPTITNSIESVLENSPAYTQGLLAGDKLIAINDTKIINVDTDFIKKINTSSEELKLQLLRENELFDVLITPYFDEENQINRLGVKLRIERLQLGVFKSFLESFTMTKYSIYQVFVNLKMLVSGSVNLKELSGPVGIVQFASSQFEHNVTQFFSVMAFISIMLGVINLFPIPVLDGGHIVFLIIEMILKRPLPSKVLIIINNIFVLSLLLLMGFIMFNDIFYWSDRTDLIEEILNK